MTRPYDQVTLCQDYQNRFWGRSRHLQNNNSRCLKQSYDIIVCPPTEFTKRQDIEKLEPQSSSQSSEPIDYGTQPEVEIRDFEDYDWVLGRKVTYHRNDKDDLDRF